MPDTTVRVGDDNLDGLRVGLRLSSGLWLDETRTLGVEAGGFVLATKSSNQVVASDGTPALARPFFDVLQGQQASKIVGFQDTTTGVATPFLAG